METTSLSWIVALCVISLLLIIAFLVNNRNETRRRLKYLERQFNAISEKKAYGASPEIKPYQPTPDIAVELKEKIDQLEYELDLHKCTINELEEIDRKARLVQSLIENGVKPEKIVSLAGEMYNFVTQEQPVNPPEPTDKVEDDKVCGLDETGNPKTDIVEDEPEYGEIIGYAEYNDAIIKEAGKADTKEDVIALYFAEGTAIPELYPKNKLNSLPKLKKAVDEFLKKKSRRR